MTEPPAPNPEQLAAALRTGTLLDLIPEIRRAVTVDEAEMRQWDERHDVDADLLRSLLLHRGQAATDPDPRGLHLRGARIRGRLDLDFLSISFAVRLEDCLLEQGITAQHANLSMLRLRRCCLRHADQPAFFGDDLQVDGWLDLNGVVLNAQAEEGAVCLLNAQLGRLSLTGANIRNTVGPAVSGECLKTDGDIHLNEGFKAEGYGEKGTIRLVGARIGGQLNFQAAELKNPVGPAVLAEGLRTDGDAWLNRGFKASGDGEQGTVRLLDARIGGRLNFRGATLSNCTGPALLASWMRTVNTMYLERGFCAEGSGERGTVRLLGAKIGGHLSFRGATLRNPAGPALLADGLQVADGLLLDEGFSGEGCSERGAVRLSGVRVGGKLNATNCVVRTPDGRNRWMIDGLTYSGLPELSRENNRDAWLELLRTGTPAYTSQPYQQLAATYRAEGQDSDVREILMAQRRDQIKRGSLGRADKWWARTTGLLLGFGYQPWRALVLLGGVLLISVGFAVILGSMGALVEAADGSTNTSNLETASTSVTTPPAPQRPCPLIERVSHGLDLGTPFLPRASSSRCQTTTAGPGVALTICSWLLQLCAWALAALFVAGFTGIVRRT